ncbi:MAG TPA: cyclic nucleotide-binding domain-containing protein [Gammaproteobacteria bacterium]|nr:cyclic nucleotide-binding domain-containing protein [Gammaproteobacteria bacterium]
MAEKSPAKLMSSHPFFDELDAADIDYLAARATRKHLKRGGVLFHHGEPADRFFLLLSGAITIEIPAIEGPSLEVQHLGEGKILGWSWLIAPYRWSFQARADEDTELLEFDGKAVRERCESDPRFGYEILKRFSSLMSDRLEASRTKMMEEWNPPGFA